MDNEELARRVAETKARFPRAAIATQDELENAFGGKESLQQLKKYIAYTLAASMPADLVKVVTANEYTSKEDIEAEKNVFAALGAEDPKALLIVHSRVPSITTQLWTWLDPHTEPSGFPIAEDSVSLSFMNHPELRIESALNQINENIRALHEALEAPYNQGKAGRKALQAALTMLDGNPRIHGDKGIKGKYEAALAHVQGRATEAQLS